jgi:hypothetical protein
MQMANEFDSMMDSPIQPARNLSAITPNDSTDLANVAKAIWVGGAGNVALIAADDSASVTLTGVAAGTVIPIRARRVLATGTTATNLVNLY